MEDSYKFKFVLPQRIDFVVEYDRQTMNKSMHDKLDEMISKNLKSYLVNNFKEQLDAPYISKDAANIFKSFCDKYVEDLYNRDAYKIQKIDNNISNMILTDIKTRHMYSLKEFEKYCKNRSYFYEYTSASSIKVYDIEGDPVTSLSVKIDRFSAFHITAYADNIASVLYEIWY